MYVNIRRICDLPVMKDCNLLTAIDHIEDTKVEWVSVIEMPVENFVRENELVLTTGMGCGHDEKLLIQFVKEIIESGASALAVAIGKYIDRIPESILLLAENHKFPIITLPWETRFSDVIEAIFGALHQRNNKLLENSKDMQQQLLTLILQGGEFSDIANYIYKRIQSPSIITDKRGHILGKSKNSKMFIQNWEEFVHSEAYAISRTPFETKDLTTSPYIRYITIKGRSVLQFMVQSSSEIQGYMLIDGVTKQHQDENFFRSTMSLLEHAAMATALCFLKENTILETELRLRDDFIWSLAKGTLTSWDQVLSRAKSLRYNVSLPYICLIGYPENLQQIYQKYEDNGLSFEHWLQSITRRMEDEIFYCGRAMYCNTMNTFQREHLITFLEIKNNNINHCVNRFLSLLDQRLSTLLPELTISWGIGKTAGVNCFHDSYHEAQIALDIGRRLKGKGHHTVYADTRMDRAMMALAENIELKNITESTLGPLLQYEQERKIELISTYLSYSQNRCNVSQTARDLNLHRQSLLYRLKKIETLTGCNLDNPDDVFLLELTIRLWTIGILA
ncbi:PucR family transcriptional regulator [Bacillus sp. Marseille-P3661]|uniref:PucR family transcriptional regulator n=1 Tax=Bacillus sp. Marseille-P3661 TaxID=1936234 RepID=UPI000C82A6BE|nr:PucR family transcriptional regulator [Bacillus sp. Marseille-P3661]